ncbi:methyltransferase domain-containing protein [Streptomyces odontomachi]|uniref:methyltransferase domain-containing protein n=1 Tax=Streptomyces odontomachi TaxID=2944940 RepID=UPI00210BB764|nr:methyltransferase domain-containing protein [Streptomyces sp. ODS25]
MAANDAGGFVPLDELTGPRPVLAVETAVHVPVETAVKERYDTLAQAGASNLCCAPQAVYGSDELDGVPQWVLDLSSGCGAPLGAITLDPGQTVADFGCGAGLDLILAARRVGPTGRVIGIDGSMSMVRTARRAVKEMGLANVDVRVGDIRRPPLRSGSVDVLFSNCVLGMFPDKAEVLAAIGDALRPGGYAVISDVVYLDEVPEGAVSADAADADDYARCVVGLTAEQYRQLVTDAGFEHVVIRDDGQVSYRDGARVASATILAYRGAAPEAPCC